MEEEKEEENGRIRRQGREDGGRKEERRKMMKECLTFLKFFQMAKIDFKILILALYHYI